MIDQGHIDFVLKDAAKALKCRVKDLEYRVDKLGLIHVRLKSIIEQLCEDVMCAGKDNPPKKTLNKVDIDNAVNALEEEWQPIPYIPILSEDADPQEFFLRLPRVQRAIEHIRRLAEQFAAENECDLSGLEYNIINGKINIRKKNLKNEKDVNAQKVNGQEDGQTDAENQKT